MQSSARKNGLKQGFHGFTLHSYLLCIGRKSFPLLANIYLNEFDQEYQKRGVVFVRYADDIVLLAKSERAAKRLLETSTKYLEGTLKLKVNQEKSRAVSVDVYKRQRDGHVRRVRVLADGHQGPGHRTGCHH